MKNEKKYITVEDLKSALQNEVADVIATYDHCEDSGFSRDRLYEIIDSVATKDVSAVVHARWIDNTFCSHCNYHEENEYGRILLSGEKKFCAGCGAKMDLEVEF